MSKNELIQKAVIDQCGAWKYENRDQLCICLKSTGEFSKGSFCYASSGQQELDGKIKSIPHWEVVCTREEFSAAADRMRGKPDWSLSPEWGQYLAQEGNGSWWFYDAEVKPGKESFSCPIGGRSQKAGIGKCLGDWRNTLEKRPEQKGTVDIPVFGGGSGGNGINFMFNGQDEEPAPAKPWFEAGEFPPAGAVCEYKFQNPKYSWQPVTVNYISNLHAILNCHLDGDEVHTDGYTAADFRPIKTDKEKAIEAAIKVCTGVNIATTTDSLTMKTLNKLYDAGLLRLPDQK